MTGPLLPLSKENYAKALLQRIEKGRRDWQAIDQERREKQIAYNEEHGIKPKGVRRSIQASLHKEDVTHDPVSLKDAHGNEDVAAVLAQLEAEMLECASSLRFEEAAILRDQIDAIKSGDFSKGTKKPFRRKGKRR